MAIEEEFGVEISDHDAWQMFTVADVYAWLKKTLPGQYNSDEEIWRRLVQVFSRQLNVHAEDVMLEKSITMDLGVD
jgi:acyl carrier protein